MSTNMARYALIIGIAEYSFFKSLETPVQNGNAIADILDQYGDFDQVKRLPFRREAGQRDLGKVIRKPLPNEILVQELQQFLQDSNGSDVLIYYSGHGFTKLDQLSQTPEGYLAPSDCQVELNAAGQVISEKNGISLFGLNALINRHTFSSLVVILDCCNAGAFLESGMIRRDVTAFDYQRDYYLITACRSSSKAYEGEKYSLLTAAMLKGLSPENAAPGSGRISGDRLFDVIGNELQNSRQEPIRMGWGRLITLVRYLQYTETSESVSQPFNPANPYMGLKPFEQEQAAYFFGREQAVRALLDRLNENRFLAVIGPSGCGKSSLVKAGLLPELKDDRIPSSSEWQIKIITPGQYPLQALASALEQHHSDVKPVVLFVDQFEELFTLCPNEEEQRTFIKRLNEETNDPDQQTRIVIAMRGDFLDRCAKFQESADLINSTAPTTYIVTPLTEAKLVAELEESITSPAALHGVSFESGLVARIVDDVINQPGAMPLLQYALTQLWANCISPDGASRLLVLRSYEAIEGVKGALQRWADQFYANLGSTDQTFVREMVSELVQLGDGGEVTRRRASWERLRQIAASQKQLERIVGQLVYQRLLVADDKTVEVAHEALLSESKLIQGWIEENRDSIRLQQRLETYRREWEEHDRAEDYLLDAGRLAAIDEWMQKKQPRLMSVDQEFIEKSRERRDQQFQAQLEQERRLREEAERRELAEIEKTLEAEARAEAEAQTAREAIARAKAERRRKQLAVAAGILGVFSIALGTLVQLRQSEVRQQQFLTIGTMIGKAEQLLETHNQLEALIASIEALNELKQVDRDMPSELSRLQSVISSVRERNRFEGHESGVYALDFSPDGKLLASGGFDKHLRIWSLDGSTNFSPILAHERSITAVRFSPDGSLLATASLDNTVKLWDVTALKNGRHTVLSSFQHEGSIRSISFSSDGEWIAASGTNRIIAVWDTKDFHKVKTLADSETIGKEYQILGVDFSPLQIPVLISSGYKDHDVAVWDLVKGDVVRRLGQSNFNIQSVKFSQDGSMFVSTQERSLIKIWNAKNGELMGVIKDGDAPVIYAEFSSDNKLLVSIRRSDILQFWSVDDAIRLWKEGKKELTSASSKLEIGAGSIVSASFMRKGPGPESQTLASGSHDGTIRIWEIFPEDFNLDKLYSSDELIEKGCSMLIDYRRTNLSISEEVRDICK